MSDAKPERPTKPRRRFWRKKRWWLLAALAAGLVWLDGPGWKWIARTAANHYLPDLGYRVDFDLEGRLTSGTIGVSGLKVDGDSVVRVAGLERLRVDYLLGRVIHGEVESIELDRLHVEVDLAAAPAQKEATSGPVDPAVLLARLRERLVPMNIRLREVGAVIRRGDETVFAIEPTTILHDPGSDRFQLDLGAATLPGGRGLSAQSTHIDWRPDRLVLDRLKLLEELAVASLEAEIGEGFRFRTLIEIADDRLALETDLDEATLVLAEGSLTAGEIRRVAEIELPLDAAVTGLDVRAGNLAGGLETLTATAAIRIDRLDHDGWIVEDAVIDARLDADGRATARLQATALDSPLTLDAAADLDRTASLLPRRATAELVSPRLQPALTALRDRFAPADDAPPPPESSLRLTASTDFNDGKPGDAEATLAIVTAGDAPPISLRASWTDRRRLAATLNLPGVTLDGGFVPGEKSYDGTAALTGFAPDSLAPWLAPFGIDVPPGIVADLEWRGRGELAGATHEGALDLTGATWTRDAETGALTAKAAGRYAWPESVTLESLEVRQGDQKIEARVALAERVLSLSKLAWNDGDETLASGTASIPVPENLADWKALLRETRPVSIDLETPELPLSKLHPFLPENIRFPEASRAQVGIKVQGTPADPELVTTVRAKALGLVDQPGIPAADLELDATGRERTLKVEGGILTADYPPAKIDLVSNWDPDQWAEDPDTVKQAKLDATLAVADFNLASLAVLIPGVRTLEGLVNANVTVGGTVGAPEPRATVTLDGGTFRMKDPEMPRVSEGTVRISATPEEVRIENLSADVSGGNLKLSGTAGLDQWKPGTLDLRLDADSLPAVRNESMIVRLSAGLDLTGPWETARLSGDIRVVDSLFFKDIELLPIGEPMTQVAEPALPSLDAPAPAELTAELPEPFAAWALDLGIKTTSPFLIRGNLASGEIYLDAKVGGTLGNPRPSGGAKLREIIAQLPFSTLEIESGEVKLRPDHPFDPLLDLRGTSRIRPYDVTIYVYGPLSEPNIQPTANPPLPETEVMTLIASGTTTAGLEDPAAATARATQLLIEEARRGRIGAVRVLRPVFSVLDKIEFQVGETDAYTSRKFNSVSFEVDENWVLTAGLSEEGNTRTKVTYLFRFR